MKRFTTQGIILARTDYGEADRIMTFITPDNGKVKAIAKGVRKSKSKLAGGIELFSISDLSLIIGKSEINTLISTRLVKHYGNIVKDLERTNLAYELIMLMNKATEDNPEASYFNLLMQALESLNDAAINLELVRVWFYAQLLKLAGQSPNLRSQKSGEKLQASQKYDFNFDTMSFQLGDTYNSDQIKYLRLLFSNNSPITLQKVQDSEKLARQTKSLVSSMLQNFVRL
ncbi:DNA repair protein RecO [Candidatus Saccharibacteria bacterium]|nr:DNA repair protein RecO [Candidatus Saccharibacteria bacterium]